MDSQTACGNGTYANKEKSIECKICPAGYACPRSDEDPIECQTGTYSLGGSSQCHSCPGGHRYVLNENASIFQHIRAVLRQTNGRI